MVCLFDPLVYRTTNKVVVSGFYGFGQYTYQDGSGFNLDHQALVFKVTLPKNTKPLIG
jgi:hypothetical protein